MCSTHCQRHWKETYTDERHKELQRDGKIRQHRRSYLLLHSSLRQQILRLVQRAIGHQRTGLQERVQTQSIAVAERDRMDQEEPSRGSRRVPIRNGILGLEQLPRYRSIDPEQERPRNRDTHDPASRGQGRLHRVDQEVPQRIRGGHQLLHRAFG